MNQRPLFLRTAIALVVILVFAVSIHPLMERDYYETFLAVLRDPGDPAAKKTAEEVVAKAKELQAEKPDLYQSQALLLAADAKDIDLIPLVPEGNYQDNRDVMSMIRKHASSSIRLGLDLNGGVEFILQLVPDEEFLATIKGDGTNGESREAFESRMRSEFDRYRDIAIEILRKRLESKKIFEAEIAPSGSDYVALRAPVVTRDEKLELLNLIKMSAKLNFRLVHPDSDALVARYKADPAAFTVPIGYELLAAQEQVHGSRKLQDRFYVVEKRAQMNGKGVTNAFVTKDEFGQRKILLRFNQQGAEDFARVTAANVGRQLAIVLDGKLYCAPSIRDAITGGGAEISGSFSEEESKNIADALVSGSFPFQIRINAVFDTDPKLGADNVANGIWVGIISLILVALFMIVYYRLAGVISVVALTLNIVLILGAMAAFDCTLTLPGIAGIVLTIGMAVDANVLVFERIREELAAGKNLRGAVDLGYQRAFSAVFDANLTTLITSIILMYVGTGAIKGFAVTLSIGILTSLFTALFVTRLIFDYLFRFTALGELHMMKFFDKTSFNFEAMWPKTLKISFVLIVLSFVLLGVRWKTMLGVDFTGGALVTFGYTEQVPKPELEKALAAAGYDATVTYKYSSAGGDSQKVEILLRGDLTADESGRSISPKDTLRAMLDKTFPQAHFSGGEESTVGGLIGREFIKAAVIAILLSMVGIVVYVSLRYEFTYALSTLLALFHDVVVVVGIYLALGRNISLTVIAALLTVIGYSVNDKVVVFDRIRENIHLKTAPTFLENVNLSINQTLSRTILTSVTTFIVVFVLFLGGGSAINDFVLVMMLGIIVGTYSSIFIAAPLVSAWHKKAGLPAAQAENRK